MPLFDISDITLRDTVLIEAYIQRFWIKAEGRPRGPAHYRAFLELKSLSLLHKDTSITPPEDEAVPAREFSDDESLAI